MNRHALIQCELSLTKLLSMLRKVHKHHDGCYPIITSTNMSNILSAEERQLISRTLLEINRLTKQSIVRLSNRQTVVRDLLSQTDIDINITLEELIAKTVDRYPPE